MAGKPRTFSNSLVELGPCDVWINPELPATAARPAITAAADGTLTPDATASPNAIHVGFTKDGAKLLYKPTYAEFIPDESTAPAITAITGEPSNVTGIWWQVLDMLTLSKMMASNYSTGSGFSQNNWGGNQKPTTYPVMIIAPIYADPTKIVVAMLYKAFNKAGFELDLSRKKQSESPFDFSAQVIATRPIGDQIGTVYTTS